MTKKRKISIIGAGAMGSAIARAAAKSRNVWQLTVINTSPEKLLYLKKDNLRINIELGYESLNDAEIVILAVKPQSFPELAEKIRPLISKNALIISIMAGTSVQGIQKLLGAKRVIRSMPNLGAQFGESMTVWTGKGTKKEDEKFAETFFSLLGKHFRVANEDMVDKATAVSGSGPGFFAYGIETYLKEAMRLGFSAEQASMLVLQTLQATNTILQKREITAEEFRAKVTSKKGTTEAGISVLMKKNLPALLRATLMAAYKRAKELSKS